MMTTTTTASSRDSHRTAMAGGRVFVTWDETADDPTAACLAQVHEALVDPVWDSLAGLFGYRLPPMPVPRMHLLVNIAAEHWDFRRGRERDQVAPPRASDRVVAGVLRAADAAGFTRDLNPSNARVDTMVVLGGLIRACLARPLYAAKLMETGVRSSRVVALAADRRLSREEREVGSRLALPDFETEADVMSYGVSRAFGLPVEAGLTRAPGHRIVVDRGAVSDVSVRTLVVGSQPDGSRANTRDTYEHLMSVLPLPQHSRALVVTTSIYVPYQASVAVGALGIAHGISVETIGTAMSGSGEWAQPFEWFHYLQEFRSAILGLEALHAALDEHL